jgi:hypothetical protein
MFHDRGDSPLVEADVVSRRALSLKAVAAGRSRDSEQNCTVKD